MIALIWAEDKNKGIGKDNKLPWSIKAEMEHFRNVTRGSIIVMGRKTFESIGRPLPKRINIVLTTNSSYKAEGCLVFNCFEEIISWYKTSNDGKDMYIIGGKQVYQLFLPYADKLIISKIHNSYECDTFMDIAYSNFKLVSKDESNSEFAIETYEK